MGGLILTQKLNSFKLRQMCVSNEFQGKLIGKKLIEEAINIVKKKSINLIHCNARKTAVSFYTKLGFKVIGKEFEEVGIPHFFMQIEI